MYGTSRASKQYPHLSTIAANFARSLADTVKRLRAAEISPASPLQPHLLSPNLYQRIPRTRQITENFG